MAVSAHSVALTGLAVIFSIVPAEARSPDVLAASTSGSRFFSASTPAEPPNGAIVVAAKGGKMVRVRSRDGRGDGEDRAQEGPSQTNEESSSAEPETLDPVAAGSAAKDPVVAPAAAATTPAPATASVATTKTAPAAIAKSDCLAGCTEGDAPRATARPPVKAAAATTPAPRAARNSDIVCFAGCGNDGPRATAQTAQTAQTQSEVQATSDEKVSNRVTILRGNSRRKVYATGN